MSEYIKGPTGWKAVSYEHGSKSRDSLDSTTLLTADAMDGAIVDGGLEID